MARSAGNAAKVLAHEGKYSNIEMPSGEIRMVQDHLRSYLYFSYFP